MCIYIDKHIYNQDYDEETVFEYLKCLFYSLSIKKKFFLTEEDYEKYSFYGATHVYLRLTNKKQFLNEDEPNYMPKIKSVLNFIKKLLYPLKINYQCENFGRVFVDEFHTDGLDESIKNDLSSQIKNSSNETLSVEVELYLSQITKTVKQILKDNSPYSNDPIISLNLYISCLLTFLRSITLSNYNKERIIDKETKNYKLNSDNLLEKMFYEENTNAPIVYHLAEEMKEYVGVMTNRIKKIICADIKDLLHYHEPSDELIKDMLMSPLSEFNEDTD